MDKALVQHPQHDVHRHHCGDNQPDSAAQRRLEGERTALEFGLDVRREAEVFLCIGNRLHRFAQRVIIRDVKRNGGGRELIQMVHRQRGIALLNVGNGAQGHNTAAAAGQAHGVKGRQAWCLPRIVLQHHPVLIGLGVDGGDQALAEGVVQRVVHIRHGDPQTAGAVTIDVDVRRQPFVLPVAADIRELRQLLKFIHQLRYPSAEGVQAGGLQGELILGAAHRGVDGQILRGLQIQRHTRDFCHRMLESFDDLVNPIVAIVQRLEVDLQAGAVQRRVGTIDADKRRQALHRRILHDNVRDRLLALRHAGKGHRLRRL